MLRKWGDSEWEAHFFTPEPRQKGYGYAESAALAICIAAVKFATWERGEPEPELP